MSADQAGAQTGYEEWPAIWGTPEPEGEGTISSNDRAMYPMPIFEELGLYEEVRYLDHDMDLRQWTAMAGIQLPRYVVNGPLSKKIIALLRHGDRYRVAMDAYGRTMFGDLMQYILLKHKHLAQELPRGEVAGVPLCDLYPYVISCINQKGARTKNRVYLIGKSRPGWGTRSVD